VEGCRATGKDLVIRFEHPCVITYNMCPSICTGGGGTGGGEGVGAGAPSCCAPFPSVWFVAWPGNDGRYYYQRLGSGDAFSAATVGELFSRMLSDPLVAEHSAAHIYLAPGTYHASSPVVLPASVKHISVVGSGRSTVFTVAPGATLFASDANYNWTQTRVFSNFAAEGQTSGSGDDLVLAHALVDISNADQVVATDLWMRGHFTYGISVSNALSAVAERLDIQVFDAEAAVLSRAFRTVLRDSRITNIHEMRLGVYDVLVLRPETAPEGAPPDYYAVIEGNTFIGGGSNINTAIAINESWATTPAGQVVIRDNVITEGPYGFAVALEADLPNSITFENNAIHSYTLISVGVHVPDSGTAVVRNNRTVTNYIPYSVYSRNILIFEGNEVSGTLYEYYLDPVIALASNVLHFRNNRIHVSVPPTASIPTGIVHIVEREGELNAVVENNWFAALGDGSVNSAIYILSTGDYRSVVVIRNNYEDENTIAVHAVAVDYWPFRGPRSRSRPFVVVYRENRLGGSMRLRSRLSDAPAEVIIDSDVKPSPIITEGPITYKLVRDYGMFTVSGSSTTYTVDVPFNLYSSTAFIRANAQLCQTPPSSIAAHLADLDGDGRVDTIRFVVKFDTPPDTACNILWHAEAPPNYS